MTARRGLTKAGYCLAAGVVAVGKIWLHHDNVSFPIALGYEDLMIEQ